MINELQNPFSVTKATDFTDSQILEYWVNFTSTDKGSKHALFAPTELIPKYIIGSKGCGKTHILRYFSYQVRKIKYKSDIAKLLDEDKYIGFYSVIGATNSSRFEGKDIKPDVWKSTFEYYFELFICDNLLQTISEIFKALKIKTSLEKKIVKEILSLFNNYNEINKILHLSDLIDYLKNLRRNIDSQIQNAAHTRKLDIDLVKVLFNQGDLIFGIPKAIAQFLDQFKDVNFVYIFDEYEKLSTWQMEFINTLVWDKRGLVTFWVGLRRYGYITRKTQSGQEMKSGSEFEPVNLDEILRSDQERYKTFTEKLYISRLKKYFSKNNKNLSPEEIKQSFQKKFEKYNELKIINQIIKKNSGKEYPHLKKFKDKLSEALESRTALNISNKKEINTVVKAISEDAKKNLLDPLEQKYRLLYFYKEWYNAKNSQTYQQLLSEINEEYEKYLINKPSKFNNIKNKWKKDLIAQLTNENDIKNTEYAGIDDFIELSQGNPRSFIIILKKVIEYSTIRGENPFEESGEISLTSQYFAVYDTAKWFFEDAELNGEEGKWIYNSIKNLTSYLMLYRFCDKPPETSVSTFYLQEEVISSNAKKCLETMEMHAFLISDKEGRKAKNSGVVEQEFQLNKILAPLWNLPVIKRGSIYLKPEAAEAIFNYEQNKKFDSLYERKKAELNAPDFLDPKNKIKQFGLFD